MLFLTDLFYRGVLTEIPNRDILGPLILGVGNMLTVKEEKEVKFGERLILRTEIDFRVIVLTGGGKGQQYTVTSGEYCLIKEGNIENTLLAITEFLVRGGPYIGMPESRGREEGFTPTEDKSKTLDGRNISDAIAQRIKEEMLARGNDQIGKERKDQIIREEIDKQLIRRLSRKVLDHLQQLTEGDADKLNLSSTSDKPSVQHEHLDEESPRMSEQKPVKPEANKELYEFLARFDFLSEEVKQKVRERIAREDQDQ